MGKEIVNVIGLGHVGLPTALMLSVHGAEVVGTDCDEALVSALGQGRVPFREPGLEALLRTALDRGVRFETGCVPAELYVIAVPTPCREQEAELSQVLSAVRAVLRCGAPEGAVLILESTVPPGTMEGVIAPLAESLGFTVGRDLHLAHAPERILPGNMLYELVHNDRILGVASEAVGDRMRRLYGRFCRGKLVLTDLRTAEMVKVAENACRAVNIAFANELSMLCRQAGVDARQVIRLCNMHPRVEILEPGPGVGGHCVNTDPWFLAQTAPAQARTIRAALETNASMPEYVWARAEEIMGETGIAPERVGLYGLAYKANVDDCRASPALQLLALTEARGLSLTAYDPLVERDVTQRQVHSLPAFLEKTDMVIILAGHDVLRKDPGVLDGKTVLDCCGLGPRPGWYAL